MANDEHNGMAFTGDAASIGFTEELGFFFEGRCAHFWTISTMKETPHNRYKTG